MRCDRFAQLLSRGLAEQMNEWYGLPEDITASDIRPLDVAHLISDMRLDVARWRAIVPHLTAVLMVKTEDLTSGYAVRRHACLARVLRFLELPPESMGVLDDELAAGGQGTSRVARLVPNLNELRKALMAEAGA